MSRPKITAVNFLKIIFYVCLSFLFLFCGKIEGSCKARPENLYRSPIVFSVPVEVVAVFMMDMLYGIELGQCKSGEWIGNMRKFSSFDLRE